MLRHLGHESVRGAAPGGPVRPRYCCSYWLLHWYIAITMWSRRPGWGSRQILALAAGALLAYAWHAFTTMPAFDSASIALVRIGYAFFAALAAAAVWIATRRVSAAERT
jgi:hypothetical protein